MNENKLKNATDYHLPASLVSQSDLNQLINELEEIDSDMTTAEVRSQVGAKQKQAMPNTSKQLAEFVSQNELNLDTDEERSHHIKQLAKLKLSAPVMHLTFARAADRASLMEIANWLRQSVHRQAVISVGLQPDLVAGVYIRSENRVYDLSLKRQLAQHRSVLLQDIKALHGTK